MRRQAGAQVGRHLIDAARVGEVGLQPGAPLDRAQPRGDGGGASARVAGPTVGPRCQRSVTGPERGDGHEFQRRFRGGRERGEIGTREHVRQPCRQHRPGAVRRGQEGRSAGVAQVQLLGSPPRRPGRVPAVAPIELDGAGAPLGRLVVLLTGERRDQLAHTGTQRHHHRVGIHVRRQPQHHALGCLGPVPVGVGGLQRHLAQFAEEILLGFRHRGRRRENDLDQLRLLPGRRGCATPRRAGRPGARSGPTDPGPA